MIRPFVRVAVCAAVGTAAVAAQATGPLFVVDGRDLHRVPKVIAYGDTRFTDPANAKAANPLARRQLVARVAEEAPDAVLLSGDVPWRGDPGDYAVYRTETEVWRTRHLRVFPALGNHEFSRCAEAQCLENWWTAFPDLRGHRWYSVRLGEAMSVIALDSDAPLTPGSEQQSWLQAQVDALPRSTRFVFVGLHHPPVADVQTRFEVDHNPRPNEIALAEYLKTAAGLSHARFIVMAGHTHNYERFVQDDVVYLVTGGGGAPPYQVDRTPSDLYQDSSFPNFHYIAFELVDGMLKARMERLADPEAAMPVWERKDVFEVRSK